MILIPKQKKTEPVINPLRPKIGVPREHTTCKISWADYHIEPDEVIRRLRVDADHKDEFVAELESTIPVEDRYRCADREIWLVDKKWKKFLVETAKKHFDKATFELRTWDGP
jgi:hypothetical protein